MPTDLISVKTFTHENVLSPFDPDLQPTQATAYWLQRDIVRGVFTPDERLKVEQLCQFYQIGQNPVREAILILATSGLLVHEHQKGYRVAPVSLHDFEDAWDIYQRLYRIAMNLAVERGDEAWEESVVLQLHRSLKVKKVLPSDDPESREMWQQAYIRLHRALLAGCQSPLLQEILLDIGGRLERYINLFADLNLDLQRDHHAEHRKIVDALVARDGERLQNLIDNLFTGGEPLRQSLVDALSKLS